MWLKGISGSKIMWSQTCGNRCLRVGLALAAALAGAGALPLEALAVPADMEAATFAAQSRVANRFGVPPEEGASQWSGLDSAASGDARNAAADIYRPYGDHAPFELSHGESFSGYARQHHGGNGGRWGDHGEFGDDHGGPCEDGCVSASAVPEPSRGSLMIAGALALLILGRRRRGAAGLFLAR
jgi:hypothetical protein